MANPGSLTRVQPGEVRNPKGRGKGTPNRATVFKKWLGAKETIKNPITKELQSLSQEDIIIMALIAKARKGDLKCAEFLLDGKYGPVLKMAGILTPQDAKSIPEDFSPFQVVDPLMDGDIVEVEIGASD